jgi:diketogulonate reductase-like aldo/keto reductase
MVNQQFQNPLAILNNGTKMPMVGLGVYDMHGPVLEKAIETALETGYRLIDTAAMYGNEQEVGRACRRSTLNRDEIFITTKVNNSDQGYDSTLRAFDSSLNKLQMDYVDLYLIHWPVKGKRKATWEALEHLYRSKRVRAIGVANYLIPFLEEIKSYSTVLPAVNQVEFTPFVYSRPLLDYCASTGIQLQAYSPIARGHKNKDPKLLQIAKKYHRTPAQIMLRWCVQHDVSPIPKSSNQSRQQENLNIFDFAISKEDMELMDEFNEDYRVAPDPMDMW